jgi:putative ATP-binding cassette transporter
MRLSMGEQQRLGFARAILAKPDWIFLDEATASVDPEAEEELYLALKKRLPDATLVSIAHRPSVAAFHDKRLNLTRQVGKTGTLVTSDVVPEPAGD